MGQRLKQFGCYLIIIVLLPYVVTVFINGPGMVETSHVDGTYVSVSGAAEMPAEDYCIGIMAREIPPDYRKEALRAQAVLVRTEVYRRIDSGGSGTTLDLPFWTQEQMEKEWGATRYSRYYNRLKNAWRDTAGQVLMYEGKPAVTPFCRLSNGSTRDGKTALGDAYPYIKAVDCPEDIEAEEQIQTVTIDDIKAEITECDEAGYVLRIKAGEKEMSGEEFRKEYHLASSCFTLQKYNGKLRITTRGVGHGLGMSQYTANEMAKDGADYEKILEHFFEGTEIAEVTDIVTGQEQDQKQDLAQKQAQKQGQDQKMESGD